MSEFFKMSMKIRIFLFMCIPLVTFAHGTNSEPGSSYEKSEQQRKQFYKNIILIPYVKSLMFKMFVDGCKIASPTTGAFIQEEYAKYIENNQEFIETGEAIVQQEGIGTQSAADYKKEVEIQTAKALEGFRKISSSEAIPLCNKLLQDIKLVNYQDEKANKKSNNQDSKQFDLWTMRNILSQDFSDRKKSICKTIQQCTSVIQTRVCKHWKPPENHSNKSVQLKISFDSVLFSISSMSVTQSSGHQGFDKSLISALRAASPYIELKGLPSNQFQEFNETQYRFSHGNDQCSVSMK